MNQPDNNILNELLELSPTLAAIPRNNVFKVPEGYFESLPAILLLQTGDAGNMGNNTVPEGYFDNLADNIMARIRQENASEKEKVSTILAGIGNKNIFTVPAGYFNTLANNIMSRISDENVSEVVEETRLISETVAGIGNKNVLTVPAGYFNAFAGTVNYKTEQPAKVVQMNGFRRFYKYAAAAIVTGLIAMTTVFIINNNNKGGDLTAADNAAIESAEKIIKTNSFDKELASLSDADIVNFLESKGQDVDAALVASLTEDAKALPEAEDYLLNENALDEVLKDLDLNN